MPRVDHNEASRAAWFEFRDSLVIRLFSLEPGEGTILDGGELGYVQFLHAPRARLLAEANPTSTGALSPSHVSTPVGQQLVRLGWSPPRTGRYGFPNYRTHWVPAGFTAAGPVDYGFVSQQDMTEAADLAIATFLVMGLALPSRLEWAHAFEESVLESYEEPVTPDELA